MPAIKRSVEVPPPGCWSMALAGHSRLMAVSSVARAAQYLSAQLVHYPRRSSQRDGALTAGLARRITTLMQPPHARIAPLARTTLRQLPLRAPTVPRALTLQVLQFCLLIVSTALTVQRITTRIQPLRAEIALLLARSGRSLGDLGNVFP